jgi:alanine dehydrogenase
MIIGIPKEIKDQEYRVSITPHGVKELKQHNHTVLIENNAGISSGFSNDDYVNSGAKIVSSIEEIFAGSQLIVKVKEPQAKERALLKPEHTLFTYLHLAADKEQTQDLIKSKATCLAYETVTDHRNKLPLLTPMSEVAGRVAIQAGARCLEKSSNGCGTLLGGVPGVKPAKVVIIGGGVVGRNATTMAIGMGADVTVLDQSLDVLRHLDDMFGNRIKTVFSTPHSLWYQSTRADLLIGSILIPGAEAPKLISKEMIAEMKPGSALVDVAIDQGGCAETSTATTHDNPIYTIDDVVHYCVANIPSIVARTSTLALSNVTLPYIIRMANHGINKALKNNPYLREGANVVNGKITCKSVAEAQGLEYTPIEDLL